ncbi:hypothetical protein HYH03_007912 [Edaphochlamys debaryana]|uniref:Protein-S-isoprenylcysteine O-methyltransferase n=1 Tax=Edaphochlamys debaryana TaxID=47281 RepID=A0A835Y7S7_9CHLO|nr:hypothetical protein HYH03_007912 [Edaphochlamys debaryana]|eukprot:KAG2493985.1 hypothetical protein HYH03_007912 [Edaphochlamys debaryana]
MLPTTPQPLSPVSAASAAADDGFARAWKPPPGEKPLWWVEKFEARRKEEAARKASDPSFVTTLERVTTESAGPNPAVQFLKGVAQVIQLVVVLALLLLLPAVVHDGGLGLHRPLVTFAAYFAFFGLGSVLRMLRYGSLTPRSKDRQVASWKDRLAFLGFVTLVPLLHMYAMYRYTGLVLYTNVISMGTTLYDLVGAVGMGLATLLNLAASFELGAAYDRVSAPEHLVTSGPYRFMQHPIYTSYMLLFFSYGMWLHSPLVALLMLLVCVLYYKRRTALEHTVLGEKFGVYYSDYVRRTKKFVPFLV